MLGDELRGTPAGLPARAAEADGLNAERAQRRQRALEVGALLVFRLRERREMCVRVVRDLVTGRDDRLDGPGIAVGRPARTKNVAGSEYSRRSSRMRGTPTSGPYAWCDMTPRLRA